MDGTDADALEFSNLHVDMLSQVAEPENFKQFWTPLADIIQLYIVKELPTVMFIRGLVPLLPPLIIIVFVILNLVVIVKTFGVKLIPVPELLFGV